MKKSIINKTVISTAFLFFLLVLVGRSSAEDAIKKNDNSKEEQSINTEMDSTKYSFSQLWSANCGRCHNKPSPDKYSDGQWETIAHHMRTRANLTGSETKKIVEFLKSAN